jgi:hypothetical protein
VHTCACTVCMCMWPSSRLRVWRDLRACAVSSFSHMRASSLWGKQAWRPRLQAIRSMTLSQWHKRWRRVCLSTCMCQHIIAALRLHVCAHVAPPGFATHSVHSVILTVSPNRITVCDTVTYREDMQAVWRSCRNLNELLRYTLRNPWSILTHRAHDMDISLFA